VVDYENSFGTPQIILKVAIVAILVFFIGIEKGKIA
jgi:hypothetical protein